MHRATVCAAAAALLLSAAGVAAGSEAAASHLRLTKSAPAKDAALTAPAEEIRLWFSMPPELAVSRIRMTTAEGESVELAEVTRGEENSLVAAVVGDMMPGSYEVSWLTSSGDGHPIRGSFAFTLTGPDVDAR